MKINKGMIYALLVTLFSISALHAQEVQDMPAGVIPQLIEPAAETAPEKAPEGEKPQALEAPAFMTADLSIATETAPEQAAVQPALQTKPVTQPAIQPRVQDQNETQVVAPEADAARQSFEESLDLKPTTSPLVQTVSVQPQAQQGTVTVEKTLQLPEIAQMPTEAQPAQIKPALAESLEKPAAKPATQEQPKPTAQSDEETCTELCKKVCLGLKEQERKVLEEEKE